MARQNWQAIRKFVPTNCPKDSFGDYQRFINPPSPSGGETGWSPERRFRPADEAGWGGRCSPVSRKY